jgi:hypothetical protein
MERRSLPDDAGRSGHAPVRRSVPDAVYDFVRDRLWQARGLELPLGSVLTPERFRCWTVADRRVDDERLDRFGAGGLMCSADVAQVVAQGVAMAMTEDDLLGLVVPDPMPRPGDPFLKRARTPYVEVGDGIYYVERSAEVERLAAVWRSAASAAGQMGVVTAGLKHMTSDELDLKQVVAEAKLVVFEAYDGVGALFFERNSAAAPVPE